MADYAGFGAFPIDRRELLARLATSPALPGTALAANPAIPG
jgi:hypothetical protein